MLAIDLVAVDQARFKIYFRSPSTTLRSVLDTMTLHGRLYRGKVPDGLKELRNLWYDLFGLRDEEPLATMEHRTAGILYYADFCLGDVFPSVKVYLPVRHYASDDRKVLGALRKAMERRDQAQKYTDYENVIMEAL
jgi:DMATS type aromatic prenyltransferase